MYKRKVVIIALNCVLLFSTLIQSVRLHVRLDDYYTDTMIFLANFLRVTPGAVG